MKTQYIVTGASSAGSFRVALQELGLGGEVIVLQDVLSYGPIKNLEKPLARLKRRRFNQKISKKINYPLEAKNVVKKIIPKNKIVIVSGGNSFSELNLMRVVSLIGGENVYLIQFELSKTRCSLGSFPPKDIKKLIKKEKKISKKDVKEIKKQFEKLKKENAELRIRKSRYKYVSGKYDFYDKLILSSIPKIKERYFGTLGKILASNMRIWANMGMDFVEWRIYELAKQKRVKIIGNLKDKNKDKVYLQK